MQRYTDFALVPTTRLELVQLSPLPPQDSVSTNFTTSALLSGAIVLGLLYLFNEELRQYKQFTSFFCTNSENPLLSTTDLPFILEFDWPDPVKQLLLQVQQRKPEQKQHLKPCRKLKLPAL